MTQIKDDEVFAELAEDETATKFLTEIDTRLVDRFTPQEKGTVLQLGCSTPFLTTGLIEKATGSSRLVVVDPRVPVLDAVRFKTGSKYSGKLFFNSKFSWERLPFDDEVFVSIISNLFWLNAPDQERFLVDLFRVMHHAGTVILSLYMRDSFRELFDIYGETLSKFDMLHVVPALTAAQASFPNRYAASEMLEDHGFSMCRVQTFDFPLEFTGSKELIQSPLVRALWLPTWNEIGGEDAERILWHLREALDRYFGDRPMKLSVRVGVLTGLK